MKCLYPANIWLKGAGPRRGGVPGNLFWAPVFYETWYDFDVNQQVRVITRKRKEERQGWQ